MFVDTLPRNPEQFDRFIRAAEVHTGAMVALIPSDEDAKRLAVEDGEPVDQLHLTLRYLGKAADFSEQSKAHLIELVRSNFAGFGPVTGDLFSVALFNPGGDEPCVVGLVGGDDVWRSYLACEAAVTESGANLPDPLQPYVAHVTLEYTGDASRVDALTDRAGPVTFDRIRIAFGGVLTDIPLTGASATRDWHPELHPRDPDGEDAGQFISAIHTLDKVSDRLKLAGRIPLEPGQTLVRSDVLDFGEGVVMPMAWTHGPDGERVRIGVGISDEDRGRWRGANLGSTLVLDESGVAKLRTALSEMGTAGDAGAARRKSLESDLDTAQAEQRRLIRTQYPNLTPAEATELDKLDGRLAEVDAHIELLEDHQRERVARLSSESQARFAQFEADKAAETERGRGIIGRYWAGGGTDGGLLGEYKGSTMRWFDLERQQRAVLLGLTPDELDELDALEALGPILANSTLEQRRRRRELLNSPSGLGEDAWWGYSRDARALDGLTAERESRIQPRRDELTESPVPLAAGDAAKLATATANVDRADRALWDLIDGLVLTSGIIPGQWGDLAYQTEMTDLGSRYSIDIRLPDSPADWSLGDNGDTTDLDAKDLQRLAAVLGGEAARAVRDWKAQPRDPEGDDAGQWVSGGGALKDTLKLAGRIQLGDGETLVGSDKVTTDGGTVRVAAVDRGDGQKVLRVGIGSWAFGGRDDEAGPWRAGPDETAKINAERAPLRAERDALGDVLGTDENDRRFGELDDMDLNEVWASGYTSVLDEATVRELHGTLTDALAVADRENTKRNDAYDRLKALDADLDAMDAQPAGWTDAMRVRYESVLAERKNLAGQIKEWDAEGSAEVARGAVAGDWADVHYQVFIDDAEVRMQLGAVPHNSGLDLHGLDDAHAYLDAGEAAKVLRLLDKMSTTGTRGRAAGGAVRKFDEHQPRDGGGRWSDTGMGFDKIQNLYGDQINEVEFDDDSFVSAHDPDGIIVYTGTHDDYHIVWDGFEDPEQARALANHIDDWLSNAQDDDGETDQSANGMVDWGIDGRFLVGYDTSGDILIRNVGEPGDREQYDTAKQMSALPGFDLGTEQASALAEALRDMASDFEDHDPADNAGQRAFHKDQPRDPHSGKWIDGIPGGAAAAVAKFKAEFAKTYGEVSSHLDSKGAHFQLKVKGEPVQVDISPWDMVQLATLFLPGGEAIGAMKLAGIVGKALQAAKVAKAAKKASILAKTAAAVASHPSTAVRLADYHLWHQPGGLLDQMWQRAQPDQATQPARAYNKKLHPKYPKGTPGGKGGEWMPQVGEALDKLANLHGRGPVKVRPEIARLKSVADVNTRLRVELRRTLKRPVDVDLGDKTNLITAKEYGEGLLRGAERWPETRLDRVSVGTPPDGHKVWGLTTVDGKTGRVEMLLDAEVSANRTTYLRSLRKGAESGRPGNDFAYIAASLFGSAVDGMTGGRGHEHVDVAVKTYLHDAGLDHSDPAQIQAGIKAQLGDHALHSRNAMVAEALADDALHGDGASPLAQQVRHQVAAAYNSTLNNGTMPAVPDLPAVTAHVAATPDIVPPAPDSLLAAKPGPALDLDKAAPATGYEALDSVPVKATFKANAHMDSSTWSATGFTGLAKPDPGGVADVQQYLRAPWFVNKRLRSPGEPLHDQSIAELSGGPVDTVKAAKAVALADRHIAALDRIMVQSSLPREIVTYRGVGLVALGGLPENAVGHSWTDAGFVSTATSRDVAEHSFAGKGSALLRIAVPKGTPALGLDGLGETEVLLGRGLTFQVTADHGVTPGGSRLLDVEVVPKGKAAIGKKGPAPAVATSVAPPAVDLAATVAQLGELAARGAAADALKKMRLPELRALMKHLGATGGKTKNDLTDRILKAIEAAPRSPDATLGRTAGSQTVTAMLRRLPRQESTRMAANATNPHFGTTGGGPTYRDAGKAGGRWTPDMGPLPSGAYEENCSNVVYAFEMRMRGFDVEAAPLDVLDKYGYAGGRTDTEMDQLLADAWRLPDGRPHGRTLRGQPWRAFAEIDADIEQNWPDGGRGVIFVGKHIFSVVKARGKAQFVEAQFDASASRTVTNLYKKKYRGSRMFSEPPQEAKLVRLDDLEPAEGVLEAVTERTGS